MCPVIQKSKYWIALVIMPFTCVSDLDRTTEINLFTAELHHTDGIMTTPSSSNDYTVS